MTRGRFPVSPRDVEQATSFGMRIHDPGDGSFSDRRQTRSARRRSRKPVTEGWSESVPR